MDSKISFEFCDSDALPAESTPSSSLEPDVIYKLCPGRHTLSDGETPAPLGQPSCGDGINYSFLVGRPEVQPEGTRDKVYIEFQGGGACWNALTCALQSGLLNLSEYYSALVGSSCSGSAAGELSLCGKRIGDADFSAYTTVAVPYCTQDVHMGDNPDASYGGGGDAVRHVGAHNAYRTLQWVFDNFPDPSDIFLTGCSAGGTALPVYYDMINTHYSLAGKTSVKVIADSPVFMLPPTFVSNYLGNWNFRTILEMIGFDYDMYKDSESFPLDIMRHVSERINKDDKFGFVTHNNDQVSIMYYLLMGGNNGRRMLPQTHSDLDIINRRTEKEGELSEWWLKLNAMLSDIENDYDNVELFVMEGDGHCFHGLNVAMEYEGFEDWASALLKKNDNLVLASNGFFSPLEDMDIVPIETAPKSNDVLSANDTFSPVEVPALVPNIAMMTNGTAIDSSLATPRASSNYALGAAAILTMRHLFSLAH